MAPSSLGVSSQARLALFPPGIANTGWFALSEVLTLRIARNFWDLVLRSSITVNRASKACINGLDEHIHSPRNLVGVLLESPEESLEIHPVEESVFKRRGDYWTIRYQG